MPNDRSLTFGVKRATDIVLASLGLLLLSPLLVVVGCLIKAEDRGPVFFRQWRVGRRGVPFRIWKFRTMIDRADSKGPALTVAGDTRITRVGHWLRSTKLDELPQLINVWLGEMSLVGPRPEVQSYVDLYSEEQREVLELKPGITDVASVKYRRESEILAESDDPHRTYVEEVMPAKIRINLEYAAQANLWKDLRVILVTLRLWPD